MRLLLRQIMVAHRSRMLKRYGSYWAIREAARAESGFRGRILTAIFDDHQRINGARLVPGLDLKDSKLSPWNARDIHIQRGCHRTQLRDLQQVTIGSNTLRTPSAQLTTFGDNIYIGASKIIGGIEVRTDVASEPMPSFILTCAESLAVSQPTRFIHRPDMDNRYFPRSQTEAGSISMTALRTCHRPIRGGPTTISRPLSIDSRYDERDEH